jgi:hypothetical protein
MHQIYSQYLQTAFRQYREQTEQVVQRGEALTRHIAKTTETNAPGHCRARPHARDPLPKGFPQWFVASEPSITNGGGVMSAAFSADGLAVITASLDNSARDWGVFPTTQALVDAAKDRLRRCLTREQRLKYFLPEAPPLWCVERRLWPYRDDDWQAWLTAKKAG